MSLTALVFIIAFGTGCVMALARHPIYGLLTYVGVFYLSPPSRWWGQSMLGVRWSLLAAGVTLLAVIIHSDKSLKHIPLRRQGGAIAYLCFTIWLAIQSLWALDAEAHRDLFSYYMKFLVVILLIYRCIDSLEHLRLFLWTHVLGCFYFGWIAFTSYEGGRFEDFGGPGLSEANAGALTIVTGILAASSLFLAGTLREKAGLLGVLPFIVNALVTTISRSGFLAASMGGLVFNWFTPSQFKRRVRILSVLALVLFGILAGPSYWQRIQSIKAMGEEIEGVDTGSGRLLIMQMQLEIFGRYPLGCGATCTAVLSPQYLPDHHLTGDGEERARASHSTYFTMLTEHGIPGAIFFGSLMMIALLNVRRLRKTVPDDGNLLSVAIPGVAAALVANFVGDFFATYAKFEIRVWFIATLMAMVNLATALNAAPATSTATPSIPARSTLARPLIMRAKR